MSNGWRNTTSPAGLGIPRSTLKALASAEDARKRALGLDVERWRSAADRAGLVGGIGKVNTGLAAPAASAVLNARATPGNLGAGIKADLLKGATGSGMSISVAVSKDLAFRQTFRSHLLLNARRGLGRGVEKIPSTLRAAGIPDTIARPKTRGLPSEILGPAAAPSVARNIAAVFDTGKLPSGLPLTTASNLLLPGQGGHLSPMFSSLPLGGTWKAGTGVWRGLRGLDTGWLSGSYRIGHISGFTRLDNLPGSILGLQALSWRLNGLLGSLRRTDFEALWRAACIREARIREARRPRTEIGLAALEAFDALYMGHPWVADRFLVDYLGIEPGGDVREALWRVLRLAFERTVTWPAKWILLDDGQAARYLRTAVHREAKRVKRDREKPDRIWFKGQPAEFSAPVLEPEDTLEFMMPRAEDPAEIVACRMDSRVQALSLLHQESSHEDSEFVELLLTGYGPADIAACYGWPKVQRFTRKANRWRAKIDSSFSG